VEDPLVAAGESDSLKTDWRAQRRAGAAAIALSAIFSAALWLGIRYFAPAIAGMDGVSSRMLFTLKWLCVAVLFCFATGIDAVAHERLQSPAFDPLRGFETHRLRVNLRYLQNTLEQLIMLVVALFGLTAYCPDGEAMRAVEATTLVWILGRLAFWAGYHRSAAMRAMGASSIALSLLVLIYVVGRVGYDAGGSIGTIVLVGIFLVFEAFLFRATRGLSAAAGTDVEH
jgi:hypothetical protein